MSQQRSQSSSLTVTVSLLAFLLLGGTFLQAQTLTATNVGKVKIKSGNKEKEVTIDFDTVKAGSFASDIRFHAPTAVTLMTDFSAQIMIYRGGGKCANSWTTTANIPFELDAEALLCGKGNDTEGYITIKKPDSTDGEAGTDEGVRIVELRKKKRLAFGEDMGIVLNIISGAKRTDREGNLVLDDEGNKIDDGYRYFEGVSFYSSIAGVYKERVTLIGMMSALDSRDDIDFEAGLSLGLLFKPGKDRNFVFSISRGYNFMVGDDGDPWYTIVGFGWNFGRQ